MATVQTTSAIRKFQTSQNNTSFKLTILQLDGILLVVDLLTMEIETRLRTFCLEPSIFMVDGKPINSAELRTKSDLLMMGSGFPIDFDVCQKMVAFVYTEINEESMADSLLKQLNQSSLGKNMYLKEAASKLVVFGN